jgi:hypothetical protein
MTSEGLGEMFEGYAADRCGTKFPLMLMGGRVEVLQGVPEYFGHFVFFEFLSFPDILLVYERGKNTCYGGGQAREVQRHWEHAQPVS